MIRTISFNSQVQSIVTDLEWVGNLAEHAYVTAIMWQGFVWPDSNEDSEPTSADEFDVSDQADSALREDLQAFWAFLPLTVRLKLVAFTPKFDPIQFAHDYALTRHGHGTGYWDRAESAYGGLNDYLTEWSQTMGEVELYLNENNEVAVSI
jgi:hypothetical protein